MPRMKMATKCRRMERLLSPSFDEVALPQEHKIDKCPIPVGKNVDLASFTFDVISFHIEDYFVAMGWVSLITLDEKVYPNIMKEFYKDLVFSPGSGHYLHVERKLDFPCIMLHHMNVVHRGHRPMALPYGMILTQIFQHCQVSFRNEVVISTKSTDIINIRTIERMKIVKENGQWVAKSKEFDDESGPSTLPFEGGEEMDEDEDEPPPRPRSHRPSSSTSSFTKNHFNLLNGRIDLLTSSVESLHHTAEDLRNTVETLQASMDGMTSLLQALHSRLDAIIPPPPPPET
ncbi:Uncharacterized protein Adt_40235 [Abeliophyllum distichum]|uniref:Uncharacterized protein n=1 Tax=Abeliophyllum distichum TaxID=126358 RepID=A0ABD1Q7C1_9LAMI